MTDKDKVNENEGGTSTGSAGLNTPEGQFTKGALGGSGKTCKKCGFVYSGVSCPNCKLTNLRLKGNNG